MKPVPEICALSAAKLSQALSEGRITSAEITEAYLKSIELNNGELNAFIEVFADDARREAALSDARRLAGAPLSPLDGVPVAVKDNIVMKGRVCSCASKMLADFVSPYDATVIARIREAGMPVLGRLNMDEFAMGGSTETSVFVMTRNPWDARRVPGGSSGGSASAVAAGMAPIALGSDTGGSIRQPASFCGVVGVKPAYGAVSRYGLVAFASSLDQIGVLSKTPLDAAMLLDVICGGDPKDMTSDASLEADFARAASTRFTDGDKPLSGYRIGVPDECMGAGLHGDVREGIEAAADNWRALGAEVTRVSIPSLPYALPAYYVISSAEASSNLARYDGIRYGYRAESYGDLDELYRKSRAEGFGDEVKRRVMLGTFALSSGYQDKYYLKAQKARELLRHETDEALGVCDALLSPVAPTPAYMAGERSDPMSMYLGDIYTVPANITGLPALSVPCGFSAEGLPIGMSLTGGRHSLPTLIAAAASYARAYNPLGGRSPYEHTEGGAAL